MDVANAVHALTRQDWINTTSRPMGWKEPYFDFVKRSAANPIARIVKIADLRDNLSAKRMAVLPEKEREGMTERYLKALRMLGALPTQELPHD